MCIRIPAHMDEQLLPSLVVSNNYLISFKDIQLAKVFGNNPQEYVSKNIFLIFIFI